MNGTATYNYDELKPEVNTDGGDVEVRVGDGNLNIFPNLNNLKNEWDLKLGDQPMNLSIESALMMAPSSWADSHSRGWMSKMELPMWNSLSLNQTPWR